MKRLHILTKPTDVADLDILDSDNLTDNMQFKAERFEVKRLRRFRRQLA
jgi:hypothetical protein